jgi:hypothetical protein
VEANTVSSNSYELLLGSETVGTVETLTNGSTVTLVEIEEPTGNSGIGIWVTTPHSQPAVPPSSEVALKSLGTKKLSLRALPDGSASIEFLDRNGKSCLNIATGSDDERASIQFKDASEQCRLLLALSPDGSPIIKTFSAEGSVVWEQGKK